MESIKSNFKINAFVESRIGGRKENQDSYGYSDTPIGFLAVVCDGMGGMNGGKTASTIAVDVILNYVKAYNEQASLEVVLSKAISEANSAIINHAQNNPELRGMGTTVTALLFNEEAVYVAHVGDSRIYQLRNHKRIFRTFDHSMVFELVRKKALTEEQARLSSQSNIITRALGVHKDVIVDTQKLNYRKGDRFVLSTDGFHSVMNEKELIANLTQNGLVNIILDNMSEKIDNIGKSKGGEHDNLTALIIEPEICSVSEDKRKKIKLISYISLSILIVLCSLCFLITNNRCNNIDEDKSTSSDTINIMQQNKEQSVTELQKTDNNTNIDNNK